jgi:hypothetical protein
MISLLDTILVTANIIEEKGRDFLYAANFPDHAGAGNNGCFYRANGHLYDEEAKNIPACIVGQVLHHFNLLHLAVENSGLAGFEAGNFSSEAIDFLNRVQRQQDNGDTWGWAFDVGIHEISESRGLHSSHWV